MSKTLLDSFLGFPFDFPSNIFNYKRRELVNTVGDAKTEVADDKYSFNFSLGQEIDTDYLKVSLKGDVLKVSYEKETENGCVKYHYSRTLPEDSDTGNLKAEIDSDNRKLSITVGRKALPKESKVKEIPVQVEGEE